MLSNIRPVELVMVGETFGTVLKRLRKAREWTQEDLAYAAGIDQASVSQYERNKHVPTLDMVGRIAGAFGMSTEELARLAGHLPPADDQPRLLPAIDDVMEIIRRDPEIVSKMAAIKESVSPETFDRLVRQLAEAWRSNGRMMLATWETALTAAATRPEGDPPT